MMLLLMMMVKMLMMVMMAVIWGRKWLDDATYFRWTGPNTLLSTQPQLIHTTIERGPRTTWETPTGKMVIFSTACFIFSHNQFRGNTTFYLILKQSFSGFFYSIIRVPPPEVNAVKADSADLSGAKVICSIRAAEPRKPSYYHSFGEIHFKQTIEKDLPPLSGLHVGFTLKCLVFLCPHWEDESTLPTERTMLLITNLNSRLVLLLFVNYRSFVKPPLSSSGSDSHIGTHSVSRSP